MCPPIWHAWRARRCERTTHEHPHLDRAENDVIALEAKEFKVSAPQDEFRDLGLRPDSAWNRWWQVLVAGLGLLLLLPVSLAIAVATKLTSRGPVLYKG